MSLITWLTSVFRTEEQNEALKKREVFKERASLFERVANEGGVQKFDNHYADSVTILDFFKSAIVSTNLTLQHHALSHTYFRHFKEHLNSQVTLAGILKVIEKFDLSESSWSEGIQGRGQTKEWKEWEVRGKIQGYLWLECFELAEKTFVDMVRVILINEKTNPNTISLCIVDCSKFCRYFGGNKKVSKLVGKYYGKKRKAISTNGLKYLLMYQEIKRGFPGLIDDARKLFSTAIDKQLAECKDTKDQLPLRDIKILYWEYLSPLQRDTIIEVSIHTATSLEDLFQVSCESPYHQQVLIPNTALQMLKLGEQSFKEMVKALPLILPALRRRELRISGKRVGNTVSAVDTSELYLMNLVSLMESGEDLARVHKVIDGFEIVPHYKTMLLELYVLKVSPLVPRELLDSGKGRVQANVE